MSLVGVEEWDAKGYIEADGCSKRRRAVKQEWL